MIDLENHIRFITKVLIFATIGFLCTLFGAGWLVYKAVLLFI